jgi:exodeoxyribonuclease VII small subunit
MKSPILTKNGLMSKQSTDTTSEKNVSEQENDSFNFENSLNELEKLVDALEHGELSLEQSLEDFERGILLTRQCQTALTEAQQKVQILLEKNDGQSSLEDFKSSNP